MKLDCPQCKTAIDPRALHDLNQGPVVCNACQATWEFDQALQRLVSVGSLRRKSEGPPPLSPSPLRPPPLKSQVTGAGPVRGAPPVQPGKLPPRPPAPPKVPATAASKSETTVEPGLRPPPAEKSNSVPPPGANQPAPQRSDSDPPQPAVQPSLPPVSQRDTVPESAAHAVEIPVTSREPLLAEQIQFPDDDGSLVKINEDFTVVQHRGKQIELHHVPFEQRDRARRIRSGIVFVACLLFLTGIVILMNYLMNR